MGAQRGCPCEEKAKASLGPSVCLYTTLACLACPELHTHPKSSVRAYTRKKNFKKAYEVTRHPTRSHPTHNHTEQAAAKLSRRAPSKFNSATPHATAIMSNGGMRCKEVYNRAVDLYAVSVCGIGWGTVVWRVAVGGDDSVRLSQRPGFASIATPAHARRPVNTLLPSLAHCAPE